MPVTLLRRQFTVREYHQMTEAGILREDDRLELIKGEIIRMSPIGPRHAAYAKRLNQLFSRKLGDRVLIGVQDPVQLDNISEPQPDVTLLEPREDFYATAHPRPEDIFLLVEIADTTVAYDRDVKVALYCDRGIAEVWLVDLKKQCLELYRQPSANGYLYVRKLQRGDSLTIQAFPDISFTADEVLG